MKKGAKLIMGLTIAFVVICGAILFYYFGAVYPKFNNLANKEFDIPGLKEGFVPQGIEYIENKKLFLVSGYMADGSPSRIYQISQETGEVVKYITLECSEGDYTGHAGGIAVNDDSLWVAGDKSLERVNLAAILDAGNGEKVKISSSFTTGNGCDFLFVYGEHLVVGEFYHHKKYITPENHAVTIAGKTNHALAYAYKINAGYEMGIEKNISFLISLPDLVQGMCLTKDGNIVLSSSYSVPSSNINIYNNVLKGEANQTKEINGKNVPLYILSNDSLINSIKAPSMSEEVVLVGGKVFVLFESACTKYKMVNRTRTKNVISLNI